MIKERRYLQPTQLAKLCVDEKWYTVGTNKDYYELLNKVGCDIELTTELIVEIAVDIQKHSEEKYIGQYELADICYAVCAKSHTCFKEV